MIQYNQTDSLILDRAGSEWYTDNGSTTAGGGEILAIFIAKNIDKWHKVCYDIVVTMSDYVNF